MISLVTVVSNDFAPSVFNLIESYRLNSCNENIYLIYFDLYEEYLTLLKENYGEQINLFKVESECPHAFNKNFYFPKAYALKIASSLETPFMMCDAAHAFVSKTYELEYMLEKEKRFFIEYPNEIFKNKYWATKKSIKLLGCDSKEFLEAQSYWAGFHAYMPTEDNKSMILEVYKYMLNSDIAGPSNLIRKPDGNDSECIAHRNDQSVLSLMINKYKFNQKFDQYKYARYGDLQTAQAMLPEVYSKIEQKSICLYSRYSKFNNFSFLSEELKNKINFIKNKNNP